VFSHVADEGFTDATAGTLLRYRANIRADDVLIFTDIKKKHRQDTFCSSACFISKSIQQTLMTFGIKAYNKNLLAIFNPAPYQSIKPLFSK
jgi:predicted TIM-barrel enzyme